MSMPVHGSRGKPAVLGSDRGTRQGCGGDWLYREIVSSLWREGSAP